MDASWQGGTVAVLLAGWQYAALRQGGTLAVLLAAGMTIRCIVAAIALAELPAGWQLVCNSLPWTL